MDDHLGFQSAYDTQRGAITIFVVEVDWMRPSDSTPPFGEPILVVLGSWQDRGAGFKSHTTITTACLEARDPDGNEDEGEKMLAELNGGESAWADLQFAMVDDDGNEMDAYSDSILWWAEFPALPDPTNIPAKHKAAE